MGSIASMFSDCIKTKDIEKPLMHVDGVYDINNRFTRVSDLVENKTVQWKEDNLQKEQNYYRCLNETMCLRKKYRADSI